MKTPSIRFRLAGLLVLLFLSSACTPVAPQRRSTDLKRDQGSEAMAKSPDISFLLQAAQSDAGQIALGSLASQKAVSSAVKELGAQLAEENRKTTDRLVSFAAQRRMTLSLTMNARDAATYYKLQHAPANKFDKEYLAAMAKDHKSNIKVFTKEAKKGEDEQIQNFAAGMVPALRDHVTRLQALRSEAKSGKMTNTR